MKPTPRWKICWCAVYLNRNHSWCHLCLEYRQRPWRFVELPDRKSTSEPASPIFGSISQCERTALARQLVAGQPGKGVIVLMHGVPCDQKILTTRAISFACRIFTFCMFDFQGSIGESVDQHRLWINISFGKPRRGRRREFCPAKKFWPVRTNRRTSAFRKSGCGFGSLADAATDQSMRWFWNLLIHDHLSAGSKTGFRPSGSDFRQTGDAAVDRMPVQNCHGEHWLGRSETN